MRNGFKREVAGRLPLAQAALEAFGFAFDSAFLDKLYERHRGRGYTDALTFPHLAGLVRSCLLEHEGSGHRGCTEAERDGTLGVDESSFYRKLAKMPVAVSRALLSEGTARLGELGAAPTARAAADLLPGCFDGLEPVILDGKKIKNAARRLKPTRGYKGALLGAKALVAMSLRGGMALAMSDSLDGQTNDVPLVPELLPQVRAVESRPILWLADRQFGGLGIPPQLTARPGDHYVLRVSTSTPFTPDPAHPARYSKDDKGRTITDEIGTFGKKSNALKVRRVTLRTGHAPNKTGKGDGAGGDVILITDLTDRKVYPASDLLKLYRRRWGIERMFQEVTETFSLQHLIGCSPKAVLFQFAFCLLMYNPSQAQGRLSRWYSSAISPPTAGWTWPSCRPATCSTTCAGNCSRGTTWNWTCPATSPPMPRPCGGGWRHCSKASGIRKSTPRPRIKSHARNPTERACWAAIPRCRRFWRER